MIKGLNYKTINKGILTLLVAFTIINLGGLFAYANSPNWGKNAYDFVKDLAMWLALGAIVIFSVKFIAKRAWVQLGGFLLLGAIVLVIIDGPERLKNIGLTLWNLIF